MKFLAKAVLFSSLCITNFAHAEPSLVRNFDHLLQTLRSGNNVSAIIHFDQCKNDGNNKVDATGALTRMNFNIFSYYLVPVNNEKKYTIATSHSMFTEHRDFGPVMVFGRLRLFSDNTAEFHTTMYDPNTYAVKSTFNYQCQVGVGSGVELFRN